jgi:hypothetical protein
MAESIVFRFFREGTRIPVSNLDKETGVEFDNERSALPTAVTFRFGAEDRATLDRMAHVRRVEDWREDGFPLNAAVEDGQVRLTGAGKRDPGRSLPPGRYAIQIQLADTPLEQNRFTAEVPHGGEALVDVHAKRAERRFHLIDDQDHDPVTWRILTSGRTSIDGMDGVTWLRHATRRSARKACLLNILAKLRLMREGGPESLANEVDSVRWADIDRVWAKVSGNVIGQLEGSPRFRKDGGPLHETHARMQKRMLGSKAADYEMVSFREMTPFRSAQIIINRPKQAGSIDSHFAEMDIDLANPFIDALSFGTHLGELVDPGRTDHLAMYDSLLGDGVKDFLYYELRPHAAAAGR